MTTAWYDPQELQDQADGDQIQPEFDPPPTPGYDEVETNADPALQVLVDRVNEVANIVATEITNDPPDVQP